MPIFNKDQIKYYKKRDGILKIFRTEEKKKCYCSVEIWAGVANKRTCLNCNRKTNLSKELKCKEFFGDNKFVQYWKVRRQGRYKELKIAPVYPQPQFVEYVTLEQEKIEKLLGGMLLSSEDGEEW